MKERQRAFVMGIAIAAVLVLALGLWMPTGALAGGGKVPSAGHAPPAPGAGKGGTHPADLPGVPQPDTVQATDEQIEVVNSWLGSVNVGDALPVKSITSIDKVDYAPSPDGNGGVIWMKVTGTDGKPYTLYLGNYSAAPAGSGQAYAVDSTANVGGTLFGDQFTEVWESLAEQAGLDPADLTISQILDNARMVTNYTPYLVAGTPWTPGMPVPPAQVADGHPTPPPGGPTTVPRTTVPHGPTTVPHGPTTVPHDPTKVPATPTTYMPVPIKNPTGSTTGSGGTPVPRVTPAPKGGTPDVYTDRPYLHIDFGGRVKNAVVVGQDPDRRGADVFVTIRSCPVVYTYWENYTVDTRRCVYSDTPPADWTGCDFDTDGDGQPDHPNDPSWTGVGALETRQRRAAVAVRDPIDLRPGRWILEARLKDSSRAWILGELRQRYPGAIIVKPLWDLSKVRTFRITANYYDGQGCNVVKMQATWIPFVDPGIYTVHARFITSGTRFRAPAGVSVAKWPRPWRTGPRVLENQRDLKVWLRDETLIR